MSDEPDGKSLTQNQDDDVWSALGGLLLVAALVGGILSAWRNPTIEARHAVKEANTLLYQGDYTQAVSLLESTLPVYDSPELRLNLSYAYLARRDSERSIRQARASVSTARTGLRPAALAQLGRALAFAGQETEALSALQEAIAAAAADPANKNSQLQARSSLWHSGISYWRKMDWTAARRAFESLLGGDDVYARSAALKLAQLDAPIDPAEANSLLVQTHPTITDPAPDPSPLPDLRVPGLAEGIAPGDIERAAGQLQRILHQAQAVGAGQAAESALLWGGFYLQQGENLLARQYLQRAIDLRPDSAPALARLGLVLLTLGDEDSAFDHLQRAEKLDPDDTLPHYALTQLHLQRKDWPAAEGEFAALRRLDPGSIELHMQMAEYHRLRGDYDKAEASYLDAVAAQQVAPYLGTEPGPSIADPVLTLARFYTDVRGLGCDKGLSTGRQAAALHPGDPAAHDAVGWALVICRQPRAALIALDKAVDGAPEVPRYRYHRAKAYVLLARYDDARVEYMRVINLDPTGPWEQLALTDLVVLPPEAAKL
jgi:tetratricopeptide (TPR) repeat protein